jgi:hypothetical protein
MRGWLTSCSESDTFFSGMRCMPAAAQPTEAARTIADFMMAADERRVWGGIEADAGNGDV